MWPLLLIVAALAVVHGAQYGDYSAVKMPAYGDYEVPRDSPQDYVPSASTALDYKDEGDRKVPVTQNQLSKDYGNSWQKPQRKQLKRIRNDEDYSDVHERRNRDNDDRKYRDDLDRPIKIEKSRDARPRVKHKRDQHDETRNDDEFSIEKYIRGINENNFGADEAHGRKSTDRIVHRKPRDREIGKTDAVFKEEDFDEEIRSIGGRTRVPSPLKEIEGPLEFPSDTEEFIPRSAEGQDLDVMPIDMMRARTAPSTPRRAGPPRLRPAQRARLDAGAGDYDPDYYDLKRLQNTRRKMAGYRTRSEAREEDWVPSEVEKLRQLENRRLMKIEGRKTILRLSPRTSITEFTTTTLTTTTTTTEIITTSSEPTLTSSESGKDQQSLAEKSRLSIMKKAGLKERKKSGPASTKPPVLLQVTKQLPTVILVEASTSADPWLRAREVRDDSPENLARVRQLMRTKLVANAKDIRDLAEDWDQLVCDYVDVSLLSNRASTSASQLVVLMFSYPTLWFIA